MKAPETVKRPNPADVVLAWVFTLCSAGGVAINLWLALRPPHAAHPARSALWGVALLLGIIWIWHSNRTRRA